VTNVSEDLFLIHEARQVAHILNKWADRNDANTHYDFNHQVFTTLTPEGQGMLQLLASQVFIKQYLVGKE
jgi:hypothetical protein